jgi:hypothetical protein
MLKTIIEWVVLVLLFKVIYDFMFGSSKGEGFYNIRPTTLIDPEYYNINQDPFDYHFKGNGYLRVGDTYGVDLKCGNVTIEDLLAWIERNHPHILHQYVYLYDPSVNIYNPRFTPRVFRELLKNLPEKHPILRILRKCLPRATRVS